MDIFSLLDSVQTIARNGLSYAANEYDEERYARLLDLATQSYAELLAAPSGAIRENFLQEMGHITPKIGSDAAIFNEKGEILLMERADGSGWCLPCGFLEPNETPAEAAVRETREETGLEIRITRLVGVFTRKPSAAMGPHTMVAIVHLGEIIGGRLQTSHEGSALRYWDIDAVTNWHGTHEVNARAAYQMWKSGPSAGAVSA